MLILQRQKVKKAIIEQLINMIPINIQLISLLCNLNQNKSMLTHDIRGTSGQQHRCAEFPIKTLDLLSQLSVLAP